jgi:spermidine synthase
MTIPANSVLTGDIADFQVKRVLHNGRTAFQTVLIADTKECGRVLVLDGTVQSSGNDEYIYHESLVQPAMVTHPDPRTVLIIGGGEGATLREVLIHPPVERAVMVDLDRELVDLCRQHLLKWSQGYFDDPRADLVFEDGGTFIERCEECFDVILIDLVDALDGGPAAQLYTKAFYTRVRERLKPGGLLVVQAMRVSGADDPRKSDHLAVRQRLQTLFPVVRSYLVYIPCFWTEWAFLVASTEPDPVALTHEQIDQRLSRRGPPGYPSLASYLRFYDADAHFRMFTLTKDIRLFLHKAPASASDAT